MKTKQFINKGILLFCTFLILSSSQVIFAKEAKDYTHLAESGTAQEIEDALKSTSGLQNQTFGTNKETLLMIALKNNRDLDIINLFIKYGSKVKAKAKDKRTPIMFAARFCTNPDVLDLVIQSSAMTKGGRQKSVLEKDKEGKTAFDYASKNPTSGIYDVLSNYATPPDQKDKETNSTSSTESSENAATTETTETDSNKTSEKAKANTENKTQTASSMHTVTTTFKPSTKKTQAIEQKTKDTATTDQVNTSTENTNTVITENKSSDNSTTPATDSSQQNVTENKTDTNAQTSTSTATKTKTTSTEIAQTAAVAATSASSTTVNSNAKETEAKTYEKSYLYDYMNDTTPTTPEKEKPSTTEITIENVNKTDKNGVTLLMKASKAGNDWDVQNLLNNGADVQLRDKDGWSALMYAVRYQNSIRLVNMLIEKGAYTRIRNKYNATPLLLAADYSQNPQILSLLLRNRSTSEDEVFKAFVLSLTSNEGSEHIQVTKIQLFLNMGISVNRVWKRKTPLMYAAQYTNSSSVIKLLLDSGANPGTQNIEGKTAFDYAKENTRLVHDDVYWSLNSVEK